MSDHVTDQALTLIRRLTQTLNRKVSEIALLLFNHKNASSFGALAGFAIAVIFTWRYLRSPGVRPRRNRPKQRDPTSQDCSLASNSKDLDVIESPIKLNLGQIVKRKLNGGRKVLFCSTDIGRSSFVRQLEPDWHVDSNLEIVSNLARFIRHQLFISDLEPGQISSKVFASKSLEQYFSCL